MMSSSEEDYVRHVFSYDERLMSFLLLLLFLYNVVYFDLCDLLHSLCVSLSLCVWFALCVCVSKINEETLTKVIDVFWVRR